MADSTKFSKSFAISITLHVIFFTILFTTMSYDKPAPSVRVNLLKDPHPAQKIVKATLIDKRAVDQVLQRQLAEERQKQEQVLAQQREAEQLKLAAEQAKQAQTKQAQAIELAKSQKAQIAETNKKAAAEKSKLDQQQAQIKKQVAQQQAQLQAQKQAEAKRDLEQKQLAAKQASAKQAQAAALKAQQDSLNAQHTEFLLSEVEKYRSAFQTEIEDNRILSAVFTGNILCKVRIKLLPDGSILSVNVVESSGNPAYDQMSMAAVYKSAPFPMPGDQELYNQLRDIVLSFRNGDQSSDAI